MEQAAGAQIGVPQAERRRSRRRHSLTEKLAIIGECLQPGASLAGVALAHGANANMVRKWVVKVSARRLWPIAVCRSGDAARGGQG
jgi:transposase-like protein